jgi:hypothetical protein
MIRSVIIDGYRGFHRFEMGDLGRVNLLVGRNNSGKTSVLEALHILSSGGDPVSLWEHCGRRGERLLHEARDPRYGSESEIDISHLFTGHDLQLGTAFRIVAENQTPRREVTFTIAESTQKERAARVPTPGEQEAGSGPRLVLLVKSFPAFEPPREVPLSRKGGITLETIDYASARRVARRGRNDSSAVRYVSTESLSGEQLVNLWDKIALTPQEELVLEALRFLDPKIQRIAAVGGLRYYTDRGGFIIKRADYPQPLPIGTLGDGTWRMLAMAIVITQCRGGVLLVDEIDTGLHYTVLENMWRLLFAAAREFDVQIFATTHSYDCVRSLASICRGEVRSHSEVTIQRIEPGRKKAVPYSEAEIWLAAERHVEIR